MKSPQIGKRQFDTGIEQKIINDNFGQCTITSRLENGCKKLTVSKVLGYDNEEEPNKLMSYMEDWRAKEKSGLSRVIKLSLQKHASLCSTHFAVELAVDCYPHTLAAEIEARKILKKPFSAQECLSVIRGALKSLVALHQDRAHSNIRPAYLTYPIAEPHNQQTFDQMILLPNLLCPCLDALPTQRIVMSRSLPVYASASLREELNMRRGPWAKSCPEGDVFALGEMVRREMLEDGSASSPQDSQKPLASRAAVQPDGDAAILGKVVQALVIEDEVRRPTAVQALQLLERLERDRKPVPQLPPASKQSFHINPIQVKKRDQSVATDFEFESTADRQVQQTKHQTDLQKPLSGARSPSESEVEESMYRNYLMSPEMDKSPPFMMITERPNDPDKRHALFDRLDSSQGADAPFTEGPQEDRYFRESGYPGSLAANLRPQPPPPPMPHYDSKKMTIEPKRSEKPLDLTRSTYLDEERLVKPHYFQTQQFGAAPLQYGPSHQRGVSVPYETKPIAYQLPEKSAYLPYVSISTSEQPGQSEISEHEVGMNKKKKKHVSRVFVTNNIHYEEASAPVEFRDTHNQQYAQQLRREISTEDRRGSSELDLVISPVQRVGLGDWASIVEQRPDPDRRLDYENKISAFR